MTKSTPSKRHALRRNTPAGAFVRRAPWLLTGAAALVLAAPVSAQVNRTLVNGSFEAPALTCSTASWSVVSAPGGGQIGWTATAADGASASCATDGANVTNPMEFWMSGFIGVTAADGDQFSELAGRGTTRIWQSVCLMNGESYDVHFQHRGRAGTDVLAMGLNPSGSTANTVATSLDGTSPPTTFSANNTAWLSTGQTQTLGAASGEYQLGFASVSSSNNSLTEGNFLDNVRLDLNPLVELVPGQNLSVTEGNTVNVQLRVVGHPTVDFDVRLRAVNGTASNSDYTVPNGTPADFVATIPPVITTAAS